MWVMSRITAGDYVISCPMSKYHRSIILTSYDFEKKHQFYHKIAASPLSVSSGARSACRVVVSTKTGGDKKYHFVPFVLFVVKKR